MKVVLWLLAVLWPIAASGQTVFFDDFEGNALLPHWSQSPPSRWEYNVSNSMLNVTALLRPSHPKSPSNFAAMGASFEPQTDFRIDVRMGWEQGAAPHRLTFHLMGAQGQGLTSFGYSNDPGFGPNPVIFGGASGQSINISALLSGMYEFAIARVAAEFSFYFEGNLFATFPDTFGLPVAGVSLFFLGPFPGQLGALRIDRIRIVPAPGSILVSMVLLMGCARRKRYARPALMKDLSDSVIPCARRQP